MDPVTAAALISTGGNLLAGHMGRQASSDAGDANRRAAEEASVRNAELQREFAQHGIRWRVQDAKAAGIHPLAALGAQLHSASPSFVGYQQEADMSMPTAMSNIGQDISRAVMAQATQEEKALKTLQIQSAQADIEGRYLDNAIKLQTLNSMNQAGTPPGLPSNSGLSSSLVGSGQGGAYVVEKAASRTHSAPGRPHEQVGQVSDVGFARTSTGLTPVPSSDVKERIEDQFIPEAMWALRNQLLPNFGSGPEAPSSNQHPISQYNYPGADSWRWHHLGQEFRPFNSKRGHFVPKRR